MCYDLLAHIQLQYENSTFENIRFEDGRLVYRLHMAVSWVLSWVERRTRKIICAENIERNFLYIFVCISINHAVYGLYGIVSFGEKN